VIRVFIVTRHDEFLRENEVEKGLGSCVKKSIRRVVEAALILFLK
jgi:hypothetical protein